MRGAGPNGSGRWDSKNGLPAYLGPLEPDLGLRPGNLQNKGLEEG